MQTATPLQPPTQHRGDDPTVGDMLWEVADLVGGAVVTLLPLLLLAFPSIVLFVLLPALLLLAVAAVPVVVVGAVLVPAYLLTRSLLRAGARLTTRLRSPDRSAPAPRGQIGGATC